MAPIAYKYYYMYYISVNVRELNKTILFKHSNINLTVQLITAGYVYIVDLTQINILLQFICLLFDIKGLDRSQK